MTTREQEERYKNIYRKIVDKWPNPKAWFEADDKVIQLAKDGTNSDFYWILWSLWKNYSLGEAFLKEESFTIKRQYKWLDSIGIDLGGYETQLLKLFSLERVKRIRGNFLQLILFTGKSELKDLTLAEVDSAYSADLFGNIKTAKLLYDALKYLGIIDRGIPVNPHRVEDAIKTLGEKGLVGASNEVRTAVKKEVEVRAVAGGHLTREEFLSFIPDVSNSAAQHSRIYDMVVLNWPNVEEWFKASVRTISVNSSTNTNPYWIVWSLNKGKPLDSGFLRQLRPQYSKKILLAIGAIREFRETEKRLFDEGCSKSFLFSSILRHLLFCGKRTIYDLTPEDIDQAETEGIGCSRDGHFHVRLAMYLLNVTDIPPIQLKEQKRRREAESPFPKPYQSIAERFIVAIGRRVFNESYKSERVRHLTAFLWWWFEQSLQSETFREMRRRHWLAYIQYVKTTRTDLAPKTQASWLNIIPLFFEWAWADCPEVMPPPFEIASGDFSILYKEHKPAGHKAFENSEDGDILIDYVMKLRPESIEEKMMRAAVIVHATSGARNSEVKCLPLDGWRWDDEDKVFKLIIRTVDKMRFQFRPLLITAEGIEAIKEIEQLRRDLGNLSPRYDKRLKEAYIHLFEFKGRLVADKNSLNRFLNRCKIACGLQGENGDLANGGTHAFRHRFGRRVFEMSEGDLKAVQHLLGHKVINMSAQYVTEDQARRNARLRDELAKGKIVGKAKDKLMWLLDQNITLPAYRAWQKAMQEAETFSEFLKMGQAHNLGYGWCINPCKSDVGCIACFNYLAEEQHLPELKALLIQSFQELSYAIHITALGDVDEALNNTKTRGIYTRLSLIKEYLEELGMPWVEIKALISGGELVDAANQSES